MTFKQMVLMDWTGGVTVYSLHLHPKTCLALCSFFCCANEFGLQCCIADFESFLWSMLPRASVMLRSVLSFYWCVEHLRIWQVQASSVVLTVYGQLKQWFIFLSNIRHEALVCFVLFYVFWRWFILFFYVKNLSSFFCMLRSKSCSAVSATCFTV